MSKCCFRSWVRAALTSIRSDVEATHAAVGMNNTRLEMILRKLDKLGVAMADVAAVLADLNDATNEVAGEVDAFGATIVALQEQIAALDPEAAAKLEELAAGAASVAVRLRGLAADPEQPVPPVEPPAEPVV